MAREVIWTPRAQADLMAVSGYLDMEWGQRAKEAFLADVEEVIACIQLFPNIFRASGHLDIREALVTKHNLLFHRGHRRTHLRALPMGHSPRSRQQALPERVG